MSLTTPEIPNFNETNSDKARKNHQSYIFMSVHFLFLAHNVWQLKLSQNQPRQKIAQLYRLLHDVELRGVRDREKQRSDRTYPQSFSCAYTKSKQKLDNIVGHLSNKEKSLSVVRFRFAGNK